MHAKPVKNRARAGAGLAVITAAALVAIPAVSDGQGAGPGTITLQEKVNEITLDDLAPKSRKGKASPGDRVLTTQSLTSAGQRAGSLYTDCAVVGKSAKLPKARLLCTVTYELSDGEIVASGSFGLSGGADMAIVGGTGAYEGASGTVRSTRPDKGFDSADVITLTD